MPIVPPGYGRASRSGCAGTGDSLITVIGEAIRSAPARSIRLA